MTITYAALMAPHSRGNAYVDLVEFETVSLTHLQEFVGGYIEVVTLADGSSMIINEDGKYNEQLRPNILATAIAYADRVIQDTDYIVGNAAIFGPPKDGENTSITTEMIERLGLNT